MKPVKTKPRFKCDFCRRVSTKGAMETHEKICWKNPNRYCELCDNRGYVRECYDEGICSDEPCIYCSQFKKSMVEEETKPDPVNDEQISIQELPF